MKQKKLMNSEQVENQFKILVDASEVDDWVTEELMTQVRTVTDMAERFNLGLAGFRFNSPDDLTVVFSDTSIVGSIFMDGNDRPCFTFND